MRLTYAVQTPEGGVSLLGATRLMTRDSEFSRVTGLYAFASLRGVKLLTDVLAEAPGWNTATKRWVISIDRGVTEPDALEYLLTLPRTEVRVPNGLALLQQQLRPTWTFHPKTLLLESGRRRPRPVSLLVGSGNLTANGQCFGHEHALIAHIPGRNAMAPYRQELMIAIEELQSVVDAATPINSKFIRDYKSVRPQRPRKPDGPEDPRSRRVVSAKPALGVGTAAALAAAANLWIEIDYVVANRGPAIEGNQIDMQRGTRVFFGFPNEQIARNSPIGTVRLIYRGRSALRNLRFGNNSMDKLDLPIPGVAGPPSYQGRTLLFTRDGQGRFSVRVGTSNQIAIWKSTSAAAGSNFSMRSGREFGVF